jgi:hypothetical protein
MVKLNFFNCNIFVKGALTLLCFNRGYNKLKIWVYIYLSFIDSISWLPFFLGICLYWLTKNVLIAEEEFEDIKGVIRIRKSKKDRQHNGQNKKTKGQTTIYKTLRIKYRSSNTNFIKNRKGKQFRSTHATHRVTLVTNPVTSHEWWRTGKFFNDKWNISNRSPHFWVIVA